MMGHARRTGFTLIEVLIVIGVIAILASIVLPRMMGAVREAREASLRAHLYELRMAVAIFQAHCGDYPNALADIMATTAPINGANGITIIAADFRGPYLTTPGSDLPKNPISNGNIEGVDWIYVRTTGTVEAKSGTAVDGSNYNTW